MAKIQLANKYRSEISSAELFEIENLKEYIKAVESFAIRAFEDKNSDDWNKLQFLLFEMNLQLMREGHGLGTPRSLREWILRDTIEHIEKQLLPQEPLSSHLNNIEVFMVWLKERIQNHRMNHHPLFTLFDNDDLTNEELRYFLANYRVNMRLFHLHIAALSLIVPFEMREELYHNLYDEFGREDFSQAHPNLFEPLMNYFGGAREEDTNPESCHLLNTIINVCWFADGLHYGIGGMGALELSGPFQHRRILAHLRRRGLSEDLVKFSVVHCELDEGHGEGWFQAGLPYMHTFEEFQRVFDGAIRVLNARAGMYDGVLKGILTRREKEPIRKS